MAQNKTIYVCKGQTKQEGKTDSDYEADKLLLTTKVPLYKFYMAAVQ